MRLKKEMHNQRLATFDIRADVQQLDSKWTSRKPYIKTLVAHANAK